MDVEEKGGNDDPRIASSYQLSAELPGHQADVRAVCALGASAFASASRDHTIRVWARDLQGQWTTTQTLAGHQHFVSALAALLPGSSQVEGGGLASAGHDSLVNIWDLNDTESPFRSLIGHEKAVVALAPTYDGKGLISGSWDHTARVWQGSECIQELKGHSQAVWAVLGVPDNRILTASADREIKLWADGKCVHTYQGHTDAVRGLQLVDGIGFLSCDNEGVLKLWTLSGECLRTLAGHTSFVYSVALLPNGDFISGSEDRSIKIWDKETGECTQSLMHPCSIWCVTSLPNGDILSAGSDGLVRVWSRDATRIAAASVLQAYDEQLSSIAIPKENVGELNTDKLPGEEVLEIPGHSEGQTLMIKKSTGVVEAYQWSSASTQWTLLGQVVDAVGSSTKSKSAVDGKEYDFVFDVDLGDGLNRKLPYNLTENPYAVAQKFIETEELPQGHLDTIANFIFENTKGFTIGPSDTAPADPFTGASRYVPGTGNTASSSATLVDPFTGAGRYVPGAQPAQRPGPQAPQVDPFTGQNRYTPSGTGVAASSTTSPGPGLAAALTFKHFPNKTFIRFDTFNADAAQKKLLELDSSLRTTESTADIALNDHERSVVSDIFKLLKETSRYHATSFTAEQIKTLTKLVSWPEAQRFPALDVLRMALLHPDAAHYFKDAQQSGSFDILSLLINNISSGGLPANTLVALRCLVNMFTHQAMRTMIGSNADRVFEAVADTASSENKHIISAVVTLIVNYATLFTSQNNEEAKIQALSIILEIMNGNLETEQVYRLLVALGTLCFADEAARGVANNLEIPGLVQKLGTTQTEAKVAQAAREVLAVLSGKF